MPEDSEDVKRFSEQFVCEIFNYLGTPGPASGSQMTAC
jgi:hypothetical protein